MKTSASTYYSEIRELLKLGIYCALVYDFQDEVCVISTNSDNLEEAMERIENHARKLFFRISKIVYFSPSI